MSIVPPAPTQKSLLPPKSANGNIDTAHGNRSPAITPSIHAYSNPLPPSTRSLNGGLDLNPDELFTKYTVSDVRSVQKRLKADADAKKEELRLMVGERYRDLLQASSSIISIAKSSQRVLEAIEECRDVIISQHDLPLPPKTAQTGGSDDRHLHMLQALSAHMKLLLDAPEHLWHLIERKKFFPAAWLFLLVRVVHRGLVRKEDSDEQSWINEGVDVLAEFPLVQRQWDVVSQFRSQIIHKSTLALREVSSSNEICAILVTLHLLDSRPLGETLGTLLFQRSKSLQLVLSWKPGTNALETSRSSSTSNGHPILQPPEQVDGGQTSVSVREIIPVLKAALGTISQTVCTARAIFQEHQPQSSLINRVLESISTDTSDSNPSKTLPDGLHLTTHALLANLTSASLNLLPENLRSYKPYVDLNSSPISLSQPQFVEKLTAWFQQSSDSWQTFTDKWFHQLYTVKELWNLRTLVRRWISGFKLNESEQSHLQSVVDELCHKRIIELWTKILADAEVEFKASLHSYISNSHQDTSAAVSPVDFLFHPPPVPVLSQNIKASADTSFQKYQSSLKQQLIGRSIHLDSVLSTLERCARTIRNDFLHMRGITDTEQPLLERLTQTYQPVANLLTSKVISIIDNEVAAIDDLTPPSGLVFLSRISTELASSSSFSETIGCSPGATHEFKNQLSSFNEMVIQKWKDSVVADIAQEYRAEPLPSPAAIAGPSPQLLQCLLSLSDSIRQLGVFHRPVQQRAIAEEALHLLLQVWIDEAWENVEGQALYDVAFLKQLAQQHGQRWQGLVNTLSEKLTSNPQPSVPVEDIEKSALEHLKRTQTLLSTLLPPSSPLVPQLLQLPLPNMSQNYHSALELAKPSPRFGMLLVENTDR